jgi:hypothetical protein
MENLPYDVEDLTEPDPLRSELQTDQEQHGGDRHKQRHHSTPSPGGKHRPRSHPGPA